MKCSDIVRDPQAWNALCFLVSVFLVIASAWELLHSCYHPRYGTINECYSELSVLQNKWYILIFLSCFSIISMGFHICSFIMRVPCSLVTAECGSILYSLVSCIVITIFVSAVSNSIDDLATNEMEMKNKCVVCPDANNPIYMMIMWAGVIVSWVGLVIVIVGKCFWDGGPDEKTRYDLGQYLNKNPDEE